MAKTIPRKRGKLSVSEQEQRDRILLFCADRDLGLSLKLLLEDCCAVVLETNFERLEARMKETAPALLLVDLYSSAQDSLKQLVQLERLSIAVPLILTRTYRSSAPIDEAIKRLGAYVFYKPVNVEMVTELVQELRKRK